MEPNRISLEEKERLTVKLPIYLRFGTLSTCHQSQIPKN